MFLPTFKYLFRLVTVFQAFSAAQAFDLGNVVLRIGVEDSARSWTVALAEIEMWKSTTVR